MKKFTKICLITSLVLLIVGGILCVAGFFAGGFHILKEVKGNDKVWWRVLDKVAAAYHWEDYEDSYEPETDPFDDWEDFGDSAVHDGKRAAAGTIPSGTYQDTGIKAAEVEELKVSIGAATVYLLESENGNFGLEVEGTGEYRCYLEEKELHLQNVDRHNAVVPSKEKVYLYIPSGMYFKKIDMEIGAGKAETEELRADEIELSAAAGTLYSEKIVCRELEAEIGAGRMELPDIEAETLHIEADAGELKARGSVSGDIKVTSGLGDVAIELAQSQDYYNYRLECAAGRIKLGNKEILAFSDNKYIDNAAAAKCSLECYAGNITMTFGK